MVQPNIEDVNINEHVINAAREYIKEFKVKPVRHSQLANMSNDHIVGFIQACIQIGEFLERIGLIRYVAPHTELMVTELIARIDNVKDFAE